MSTVKARRSDFTVEPRTGLLARFLLGLRSVCVGSEIRIVAAAALCATPVMALAMVAAGANLFSAVKVAALAVTAAGACAAIVLGLAAASMPKRSPTIELRVSDWGSKRRRK